MPTRSRTDVVTAYRHLYRHSLRAVQYSSPARHVLKDRIRRAFRRGDPEDFDQARVNNTLEFLSAAAISTSIEHHVVRNLMHTWFYEPDFLKEYRRYGKLRLMHRRAAANLFRIYRDIQAIKYRANTYDAFNHTIRMLNESMGMCLPAGD